MFVKTLMPTEIKNALSCYVSILLSAVALAIHGLPSSADAALQLNQAAVAAGEWWRVVTCHFTHWSPDHFATDFMMFALLGGACEWTSRPRMLVTLAVSLVAIPLAVLAFQPGLQTYRGLSGIDSAFFGLLAFELLREKMGAFDRRSILGIGLLIAAFVAKTAFETLTGATLFVDSAAGGFVPVPLAHLVGFAAGAVTSLVAWRWAASGIHPRLAPLRWPAT